MKTSLEFRVLHPSDAAERAEYLYWIATYGNGFVGAFRWGSHHRIHRADCPDAQNPTQSEDKKEAIRVCSLDRSEIEQWATKNDYGGLRPCGHCRQSGRL